MTSNKGILQQLSGVYMNFKVNSDMTTGTLKVGTRYGLKFDPAKGPENWKVFDATTGDFKDLAIAADMRLKEKFGSGSGE